MQARPNPASDTDPAPHPNTEGAKLPTASKLEESGCGGGRHERARWKSRQVLRHRFHAHSNPVGSASGADGATGRPTMEGPSPIQVGLIGFCNTRRQGWPRAQRFVTAVSWTAAPPWSNSVTVVALSAEGTIFVNRRSVSSVPPR